MKPRYTIGVLVYDLYGNVGIVDSVPTSSGGAYGVQIADARGRPAGNGRAFLVQSELRAVPKAEQRAARQLWEAVYGPRPTATHNPSRLPPDETRLQQVEQHVVAGFRGVGGVGYRKVPANIAAAKAVRDEIRQPTVRAMASERIAELENAWERDREAQRIHNPSSASGTLTWTKTSKVIPRGPTGPYTANIYTSGSYTSGSPDRFPFQQQNHFTIERGVDGWDGWTALLHTRNLQTGHTGKTRMGIGYKSTVSDLKRAAEAWKANDLRRDNSQDAPRPNNALRAFAIGALVGVAVESQYGMAASLRGKKKSKEARMARKNPRPSPVVLDRVPMGEHVVGDYRYTFSPSRWQKGKVAVECHDEGRYMGKNTLLLEKFSPTYSHRAGYTLIPANALKLLEAAGAGGEYVSPKEVRERKAKDKANQAVIKFVQAAGGRVVREDGYRTELEIDTPLGPLRVTPHGPRTVFTQFQDTDRARSLGGPNGKWNFHGEDAIDDFKESLTHLLARKNPRPYRSR